MNMRDASRQGGAEQRCEIVIGRNSLDWTCTGTNLGLWLIAYPAQSVRGRPHKELLCKVIYLFLLPLPPRCYLLLLIQPRHFFFHHLVSILYDKSITVDHNQRSNLPLTERAPKPESTDIITPFQTSKKVTSRARGFSPL
jgi:hypothetical protein